MTAKLCFDDLPVGTIFEGGNVTVSADDIKRFAAQFDPQPFHLDEKAAEATFFKGLAGSGWHTSALTMRLITEALPIAGGLIGAGVDELRWPNALRPGDTLRIRSEVIEARLLKSRAGMGLVRFRVTTLNQKDEAVQEMIPNLFAPTRAAVSASLAGA
jgi:acyl dehydratase